MSVAVKPSKHSAPGQYLGFALQPVRLCYHLLTCEKGASVSLEHHDDVAIHHADGTLTLEQTKSALKQNPMSDWASDLWKAVANWLDSAAKGEINADETNFLFYVTPIHTGARSQALSAAKTADDVALLVSELRTELAKLKKPPGCLTYLQRFLDASPDEQFAIVGKLTVLSIDDDPVDPLRALITTAVDPTLVDILCQTAIGMAKEQADRLIWDRKPAVLNGDLFKIAFRDFVRKNNLPGFLTSFTKPPPAGEITSMLSTRPTFIRQLDLIKVANDDRVRAVSDYLRASADKSRWAEVGLVFEDNLKEWDETLVHRHSLIAGEIADLYADKAGEIRGRMTYRRCAQLQAPLEGRVVPGHFVHGCFNALADERRLGWHPDFNELLKELEP